MTPQALFHGETFDPARDGERLAGLLARVREYMADGEWHTLSQIQQACGGTEASCSARLRDLRKLGQVVERQYVSKGLWCYRIGGRP